MMYVLVSATGIVGGKSGCYVCERNVGQHAECRGFGDLVVLTGYDVDNRSFAF